MEDEFDYRKDLADIEEFCDYIDEVLNELDIGKTAQMQLDEERRLFYVALTRAKTDIYILTERSNISDYILKIQNYIKK